MEQINYTTPPLVGTIEVFGRRTVRLTKVTPYIRLRDGMPSFVLHWHDKHGTHFTSGLKSKSLTRVKDKNVDPNERSHGEGTSGVSVLRGAQTAALQSPQNFLKKDSDRES
ncbi:hypothetical protein [Asticcacaulis tiandongensis]|uniref:hypothetical protein n=1 Tax=Asticcacaulis tiandongensis TaxID=2565365 RepID=UPI00112EDFB9|nr:hypothetical protein [Asticcacaulis tiandongensis]